MDQWQHLLSEDDVTFSNETKGQIRDTFDGHGCHSCRQSWLRYYLPKLHLWTYVYFLILHLALALTLIILTKNNGLSASKNHMDISSYCKLSDKKKSPLMMVQPLY